MGYNELGNDWQHSLVLATGSADGSIHVFDLSKGQVSFLFFFLDVARCFSSLLYSELTPELLFCLWFRFVLCRRAGQHVLLHAIIRIRKTRAINSAEGTGE